MNNEFILINEVKVNIETWNFDQLENYVFRNVHLYEDRENKTKVLKGFTYLGPDEINDLKNSSKLDHKAVVALNEDSLIGIILCEWEDRVVDTPAFGRYRIRLIDINKHFRNQKVGSNLIKTLDQSDFIKSKILQRGVSSPDGWEYIRKVFDRELKGEDYILIPHDYLLETPPKKPGVYNKIGKLTASNRS